MRQHALCETNRAAPVRSCTRTQTEQVRNKQQSGGVNFGVGCNRLGLVQSSSSIGSSSSTVTRIRVNQPADNNECVEQPEKALVFVVMFQLPTL